jgi:signal transduction histidine kinase
MDADDALTAEFRQRILPMVSQTWVGTCPTRRPPPRGNLPAVLAAAVDQIRQRVERLHFDLDSENDRPADRFRQRHLRFLADEAAAIARTLHHVSDLAAPHALSREWVATRIVLEGLVQDAVREGRERGAQLPTFLVDADDGLLHVDPEMIRRVLRTLVNNAIDAAGPNGEVVVTSVQYADALEIEVADSGDGLTNHAKAWLFEPGFTTKPAGTGVALAAARAMIDELGGVIEATNCPEGGTAFTIRLPLPQTARQAA